MKVGIGVTTYKRLDCLNVWLDHFTKYVLSDNKNYKVQLSIAFDSDDDRQGIAARKNQNLRELSDCDFVFLFDDDCYPIKDGWIEFFINSPFNHLLFCNEKLHRKKSTYGEIDFFADCGGPFMFMTRFAIDQVGAFNTEFGLYGFEHADYSQRIVGSPDHYPMLKGTEEYIYSEDYSNLHHKSSIENDERNLLIINNIELWQSKNRPKYIPL